MGRVLLMHKSRYIVKGVFKMLKNLESALFKKGISKKAFAEFFRSKRKDDSKQDFWCL